MCCPLIESCSQHLSDNNNYPKIIMLGKLSQIKHFITNAITSLESQKPTVPSDPNLDRKLKYMLDYVLKNPLALQFKAYHELQSPQMQLNQLLSHIYHSNTADTEQITSIIHFFTFLMINCANELVTCKIVSTKLVVEMTEVYLDRVQSSATNPNIDFQEVNSYKIALIKAYVSRLDSETIKYMIINEKMAILENCVATYQLYIEHEQAQQLGVEVTCIANSILKIIHFLAEHPQHAPALIYRGGQKGIAYLLVGVVKNIHGMMLAILKSQQIEEDLLERLESRIMLLVDMVASITQEEYRREVIQQTYKELSDFRELFEEIVVQYTLKGPWDGHNYLKSLELIKVLLKLLTIYFQSHQLISIFEKHLLSLMSRFVAYFQHSLDILPNHSQQSEVSEDGERIKIVSMFCMNMEILNMILRNGGYLQRKASNTEQQKEMKIALTNTIVDIIQLLLSEKAQLAQYICLKSIKLMLQALMQLTLENNYTLHEYSALKLHQYFIYNLRTLLKNSEDWNYVVMHYESLMKSISNHLLSNESHNSIEYSHCQYHDPKKRRAISTNEAVSNAILVNECMRNFRFIIVEKTYVSINNIKLEKTYHMNFISPGWQMSPGSLIEATVTQVCHLMHLLNGVKIPVVVVQDDDCLIFAVAEETGHRVVANIRYKMILGFNLEHETIHVQLKGAQEVLVQAHKNAKQNSLKFREYIIQRRDMCRQRELKFIHHYIDIYHIDNIKIIGQMGELEIEPVSPKRLIVPKQPPQQQWINKIQNEQIIEPNVDEIVLDRQK